MLCKTLAVVSLTMGISMPIFAADAACKGKTEAEAALIVLEKKYEHTISNEFNTDPLTAMKYYDTSRIQMFDAMSADKHGGLEVSTESFPAHFKDIGPQYVGTMEFLELKAHACGDVGFVSMIQHYSGKDDKGHSFDWTLRATDGFEKVNGEWKIVHEHLSFPINMATQKAAMNSKY
jgi:ketosteroid isomerase-like protein